MLWKQSRNHPDAQGPPGGDKSLGLIASQTGFLQNPLRGELSHRRLAPASLCKLACGGAGSRQWGHKKGGLDKELRFLAKQERRIQELPTTKTETFSLGSFALGSREKTLFSIIQMEIFLLIPLSIPIGCLVPGKSKQKVTC